VQLPYDIVLLLRVTTNIEPGVEVLSICENIWQQKVQQCPQLQCTIGLTYIHDKTTHSKNGNLGQSYTSPQAIVASDSTMQQAVHISGSYRIIKPLLIR
jgi:hypothetical protein